MSYNEVRIGDENALSDVMSGIYEKHYTIGKDDVVLDLGAHIGGFTMAVAPRCRKVVAFEPEPFNFKKLASNTVRLLDEGCDVSAIRAAAGEAHCVGILHINPENSGGHSLFFEPGAPHDTVNVWVFDIGAWLKECKVVPTFIKIDTEGSEVEIILSLKRHKIKCHMAIETHTIGIYVACTALLRHQGYKIYPEEPHIGVCYAMP